MRFVRRLRLRGLSTPVGGLAFDTLPDTEKRAVEGFVSFLEGRRAMHENLNVEFDHEVFASLEEVRRQADATLRQLSRGSPLHELIERFRDTCVAFFREVPPPKTGPFEPLSPAYREALERFRDRVGPILGALERTTGLVVRGGLTKLPRYWRDLPEDV